MSYLWHIGMKVVCIDGKIRNGTQRTHKEIFPKENEIYTIRDIFEDKNEIAFHLEEIINKPHKYFWKGSLILEEVTFSSFRFKPLVELPPVEKTIKILEDA
jgi:hypothetical protein